MKKLRKLSLHQLDEVELGKRQEGLLFGGGTHGECKCGSCSTTGELPARWITELLIGTQVIQFQEVTRMLNVYANLAQYLVQCL